MLATDELTSVREQMIVYHDQYNQGKKEIGTKSETDAVSALRFSQMGQSMDFNKEKPSRQPQLVPDKLAKKSNDDEEVVESTQEVIAKAERLRRSFLRFAIIFYLLLLVVIPIVWYAFWGKISDSYEAADALGLRLEINSCNLHFVNSGTNILTIKSWAPKNIKSYTNPLNIP